MEAKAFSVTTRCEPCREMPSPPPITTPSMMDTRGFLYVASLPLSVYSAAKKSSTSCASPLKILSRAKRTSPPAQKAFGLVVYNTIWSMESSSSQFLTALAMMSIISGFSEFKALGRFNSITPVRWRTEVSTGAVESTDLVMHPSFAQVSRFFLWFSRGSLL